MQNSFLASYDVPPLVYVTTAIKSYVKFKTVHCNTQALYRHFSATKVHSFIPRIYMVPLLKGAPSND